MIKVTIFEDNDQLRQNLASFLNWDDEIEVVGEFPNVLHVEENIKATMPDVVIMDIDMPGRSGIEGIKRLRSVSTSIQVMMLTVFEDDENIFNALRAGANGYLLKKTPPVKIAEAVKELMENGSPMSGSVARRVLHHFQPLPTHTEVSTALTKRESEILDLLVKGNSYKMIAAEFNISQNTVRNHIHNIYDKLHVSSATEAAYKAFGK